MKARSLLLPLASLLLCATLSACGDDEEKAPADNNAPATNNDTNNNTTDTNNDTNNDTTGTNNDTTGTNNDTTGTNNDTNNNTTNTNNTNNMTGVFLEEGSDYADCLTGCLNEGNKGEINLNNATVDGIRGILDAEDHVLPSDGGNLPYGDLDIFTWIAPPRAVVDFTVRSPAGSQLDPVMSLHNGFGVVAFAYADDGSTEARHRIIFPYVNDTPMFLIIEDAVNFNNFPTGPYVGGDNFEYEVSWESSPFAPVELGTLASGGTLNHTATLSTRGDMHLYRFMAAEGVNPQLVVTPGTADFSPIVSQLNAFGGQAAFNDFSCSEGGPVVRTWQGVGMHTDERLFAVWDCNGNARADFTYTIALTAP